MKMENEKIIEIAKQISDFCKNRKTCHECKFYMQDKGDCLFFHKYPLNWRLDLVEHKSPAEDVPVVEDNKNCDKWAEFRDFMYQLHEMRNEGCNGCEEPPTTCRKCMQDYYWINAKHYL